MELRFDSNIENEVDNSCRVIAAPNKALQSFCGTMHQYHSPTLLIPGLSTPDPYVHTNKLLIILFSVFSVGMAGTTLLVSLKNETSLFNYLVIVTRSFIKGVYRHFLVYKIKHWYRSNICTFL